MANRPSETYRAVVEVARAYLGPAGERFMRRQIETHLSIPPENIKSSDIPELVTWSRLAFAMLTDDSEHIEAFAGDLLALRKKKSETNHVRGH